MDIDSYEFSEITNFEQQTKQKFISKTYKAVGTRRYE